MPIHVRTLYNAILLYQWPVVHILDHTPRVSDSHSHSNAQWKTSSLWFWGESFWTKNAASHSNIKLPFSETSYRGQAKERNHDWWTSAGCHRVGHTSLLLDVESEMGSLEETWSEIYWTHLPLWITTRYRKFDHWKLVVWYAISVFKMDKSLWTLRSDGF